MSEEASFAVLVQNIRAGDDQAAAEIVRRYEPAIRRAIRFRLSDTRLNSIFDSMDICQSVMASFFVRAASGQFEMQSPDGIRQLLVAMANKKLAMQVRKQRAQRRDNRRVAPNALDDLQLADGGSSPSQQIAARELLGEFQRRLTEQERQIVAWRQEDVEWAEIAARLNSSPEAVRKQFTRALDRVAAELGIDDGDGVP